MMNKAIAALNEKKEYFIKEEEYYRKHNQNYLADRCKRNISELDKAIQILKDGSK